MPPETPPCKGGPVREPATARNQRFRRARMPEPWVYTVASSRGVENYLGGIQIVGAGPGIDSAGQGADGILAVRAFEEGDLLLLDKPEVRAALVNDDGIHRPAAQRRADGPEFLHVTINVFVEMVHQDPGTLSGNGDEPFLLLGALLLDAIDYHQGQARNGQFRSEERR